jgi:hypothetical protein
MKGAAVSRWWILTPLAALWLWYAFELNPTITEIVHRYRDQAWMVIAVGAVIGALSTWAWHHLLVQ